MSRTLTGTLDWSSEPPYVRLTIDGSRKAFRLATSDPKEAERRQEMLAGLVRKLTEARQSAHAEALCRQAATADERMLQGIHKIVDGLIVGRERPVATSPSQPIMVANGGITFKQVGDAWTSGELAKKYRQRIKEIDHTENIGRLARYVYPVEFNGRTIAATPMREFSVDHADHVLAQPDLPDGSVRHVAQVVSRIAKLAAYPLKAIERSPLPQGWLPPRSAAKAKCYLFPDEEGAFQGNTRVPLVRRLLVGFCGREGTRMENAVTVEWSAFAFAESGEVMVAFDKMKNGREGTWVLDGGTAEAIRRWRTICPSKKYVFPSAALPGHRGGGEWPLYVDHIADELRDGLLEAGVTREKLFERSKNRIRLRAHDLRASFVTLALGPHQKNEAWVMTRTGHCSSQMIALYWRQAKTAVELKLTWFKPLHEIIPELRDIRLQ